jgi:hypothetical protein
MAMVTRMVCDHCGLDDSKGGVGPGNIVGIDLRLKIGEPVITCAPDLCDTCREELVRAITRWTTSKEDRR